MGETPDPPWVYADAAASDASRQAGKAASQMERLLNLLATKGILTDAERAYCLYVPF